MSIRVLVVARTAGDTHASSCSKRDGDMDDRHPTFPATTMRGEGALLVDPLADLVEDGRAALEPSVLARLGRVAGERGLALDLEVKK